MKSLMHFVNIKKIKRFCFSGISHLGCKFFARSHTFITFFLISRKGWEGEGKLEDRRGGLKVEGREREMEREGASHTVKKAESLSAVTKPFMADKRLCTGSMQILCAMTVSNGRLYKHTSKQQRPLEDDAYNKPRCSALYYACTFIRWAYFFS